MFLLQLAFLLQFKEIFEILYLFSMFNVEEIILLVQVQGSKLNLWFLIKILD